MAKKHDGSARAAEHAVTSERAARLYQMLRILGQGPQTRMTVSKRLHLDVRGFYRDLELLRASGIAVGLRKGRYTLEEEERTAATKLPFPDPRLNLGEALQLAKGRTPAHRRLRQHIATLFR